VMPGAHSCTPTGDTPPEPAHLPCGGDIASILGETTPPEPEPADGEWVDIPGGLQKRVIHPPEPEREDG
jgi:hypothetical protein